MTKKYPDGVVQSICTTSATFFAIGVAFVGYWGYNRNAGPWSKSDLLIIVMFIASFLFLARTPVLATKGSEDGNFESNISKAKKSFARGSILLVASIFVALLVGFINDVALPK